VHSALIEALDSRRPQIRARWENLLKGERVNTPLARPEFIVYLIDPTLDRIFAELRHQPRAKTNTDVAAADLKRASCECGRNPLLVFFLSGEQALLEELIHLQARAPAIAGEPRTVQVAELYLAIRREARREVGAFCSVCVHAGGGANGSAQSAAAAV
jgi:hypothetical protein